MHQQSIIKQKPGYGLTAKLWIKNKIHYLYL